MSDAKCYHVELRRSVDTTLGGAMLFRCAAKDCGKAFAVRVIDENSPESLTGAHPPCGEERNSIITIKL